MSKTKSNPLEKYEIQWVDVVKDTRYWEQILNEDIFPQTQFQVSDQLLKDYYNAAAELLNEENWNSARDAFLFLTFLNPSYQNFWIGLGIAEQASGDFNAALVAYLLAEIIDSTNPTVHTNAYQCHLALGNKQAADWSNHKALLACGNKVEYAQIKAEFEAFIKQREHVNLKEAS